MAKGSGVGTIVGLGVAGVGVWWASTQNWFGLFGGVAAPVAPVVSGGTTSSGGTSGGTTGTSGGTSGGTGTSGGSGTQQAAPPSAATVALVGSVNTTSNNALQGNVSINGVVQNLAVIPGGGAYNTSGIDQTSALAALGVTPAQIYALLEAAYASQQAAAPAAKTTTFNPPARTNNVGNRGAPAAASNAISSLPLVGAVSKTLNNALKATVMFLGSPMSVSIIPNSWTVWNDGGQNITSQFTNAGVNIQALYAEMQAALPGGMGAYRPTMVFANRGNYVRAGSRYR